jgi:SAM-dependent methyltransferase
MSGRTAGKAFLALFFSAIFAAACGGGSSESPTASSDEITLRNATRDAVDYGLKPADTDAAFEPRSLAPTQIHRYPGDRKLDIRFLSGEKATTYRLSPGRPYAFRYNENDLLDLYDGSHGRADVADLAPFVATPMPVVEGMLMLARAGPEDLIYDLGCGDGRIVITAASKYGARGVGIELDPKLVEKCRAGAREAGVDARVRFRMEDATRTDVSDATIVALYLLPESNELLRDRLDKLLKPGARVVTHNYPVPGWESRQQKMVVVKAEDGEMHSIYLYRR